MSEDKRKDAQAGNDRTQPPKGADNKKGDPPAAVPSGGARGGPGDKAQPPSPKSDKPSGKPTPPTASGDKTSAGSGQTTGHETGQNVGQKIGQKIEDNAGHKAAGDKSGQPSASAPASAATSASAASTAAASPSRGPASTPASAPSGTQRASGSGGGPAEPKPPRDDGRGSRGSSGGGPGSGVMALAIIALIVAILALIGGGWLYLRGEQKIASLDARVNTIEKGMQSNVQDVVMPRLSKFDQQLQALSGQIDKQSELIDQQSQQGKQQSQQQAQKLASVQDSVQAVQAKTVKLADRVDGTINRSTLDQIESLLRTANQRLQLYNDPQGAQRALGLANDAIGRMGDPRLFKVRGEISSEIAALQALPNPDIEGLSLKLAAAIKQVPKLPLASSVPSEYANAASAANGQSGDQSGKGAQGDGGQSGDGGLSYASVKASLTSGWGSFKESVGNALSGMLTIRQSDGTQRALLPPDQAFFLSQNLQLQLRAARLALLKQDTQSYSDGLASAKKWLGDYYDTSAAPVSSMRKQLSQMSGVKLDWDAPDISKSLSMLRDLMAQRAGGGASGRGNTTQSGGQAGQGGQ